MSCALVIYDAAALLGGSGNVRVPNFQSFVTGWAAGYFGTPISI
jgi:hypothetical protein